MNFTTYWFDKTLSKDEKHTQLLKTAEGLLSRHEVRKAEWLELTERYQERSISSFDPGAITGQSRNFKSYNVTKIAVDAVVAKLRLNIPAPRVITTDAPEVAQEKAKAAERLCLGVIDANNAHELAERSLRDACLLGLGVGKIFEDGEDICIEYVHPSEIVVDESCAQDGNTSSLYQIKLMSLPHLLSLFPEIDTSDINADFTSDDGVKYIRVIEAWRLPVGKEKGCHMIITRTETLFEEEWEDRHFPFAFIRWKNIGWYGYGIGHEIAGYAIEIDEVSEALQINRELWANATSMAVKMGDKIKKEQLTDNGFGNIIEYSETPPQMLLHSFAPTQVFEYLNGLKKDALDLVGISEYDATARKPAGLTSGKALLIHLDVQAQRLNPISRQYSSFYNQLAQRIVECARRLGEKNPDWAVKYKDNSGIYQVKWQDVDLDESKFEIKFEVSSAMALTMSGKQEWISGLIKDGLISDRSEARQLYGHPDLEKSDRLSVAMRDYFETLFERFLNDGQKAYEAPEPFLDLPMGMDLAKSYYARSFITGARKEKRDLLAKWIIEAQEIMAPPAPPPPQMLPPGPPQMLTPGPAQLPVPGSIDPNIDKLPQ